MIRLKSWAYIKYWYTLPQEKKDILRKMASRRRKEYWQIRRDAHPWVMKVELFVGTVLFIVLPLELMMYLIYLFGQFVIIDWWWH